MHQLQQSLQAAGALLVQQVLELEADEGSEDAAGKSYMEVVARNTLLRSWLQPNLPCCQFPVPHNLLSMAI